MNIYRVILCILTLCSTYGRSEDGGFNIARTYLSPYIIKRDNAPDIEIKVKGNKRLCEQIENRDEFINARHKTDLNPVMEVVHIDQEFFVNITWTATPDTDGYYPRKYLLFMDMFSHTDISFTNRLCIILKLKGKRKAKHNEVCIPMFYDSLKLSDLSDTYLQVHILSLPDKLRNSICKRRGTRAVNTCSTVECSETSYGFPLSKSFHEYEYCECFHQHHGAPNISLQQSNNGTINITVTNLPPYSGDLEAVISANGSLSNTVDTVRFHNIVNGTVTVTSKKRLVEGLYVVYFYTVEESLCKLPRDNVNNIKSTCSETSIFPISTEIILKPLKENHKPKKTIIGIFCGIVGGTVFVTCLIFVVCKRSSSRAAKTSSKQCDESRNNFRLNQTNAEPIEEDRPLFEQFDKPVIYRNKDQRKVISLHDDLIQPHKPTTTMLLHQPSEERQEITDSFITQMIANGVKFATTDEKIATNWMDFAESVIDQFNQIVIILSEELFTLCHNYKSRTKQDSLLEKTRHYELVPCVVLEKLRVKLIENPARDDFMIHLVSLQSDPIAGEQLIYKFLEDQETIKRSKTYQIYCFKFDSCLEIRNVDVFKTLLANLKGFH